MPKQSRKTYDQAALYEYAIGALARRMRSVAELKRLMRHKLGPAENGEALVEAVVARLKQQQYLNDWRYAADYSSYRRDNDKFGARRVISDLKAKGVHAEVIDQAVASAYEEVNEEKQAREFLRRKRLPRPSDQRQTARIFRALVRAGFGTRTIFAVLKKWDVDDEMLTALESELAP